MQDHLAYLYGFNLQYAEKLVKDVSVEQMAAQPGGVVNHPAWTLGHLVTSADHLGQLLGLDSRLPDGWSETFGYAAASPDGSPPVLKEALLDALRQQHARNTEAAKATAPEKFAEPHPNENTRKYFPTVGDMFIFMMTSHEMDHLGQLAAWRRAMGLGPAS